jgi:hypothetical protein
MNTLQWGAENNLMSAPRSSQWAQNAIDHHKTIIIVFNAPRKYAKTPVRYRLMNALIGAYKVICRYIWERRFLMGRTMQEHAAANGLL